MQERPLDPISMIRPRRKITGISAILLPFTESGAVDWRAFEEHVRRTAEADLTPAVNMDTGYVHLLDDKLRREVLDRTRRSLGDAPFVAGAFVADHPGDRFDTDAYCRQIEMIEQFGATPVLFQSFGLTAGGASEILARYHELARACARFIAFELGTMFAPFGKIYDLETYAGLLDVAQCVGAKHSSLSRELEWRRLILRDERRPDFRVYTGNDLAIDMVMYGSDYLLGLSTFAPDLFARRDRMWLEGDPGFHELNDILQYLGFFAFRNPTPAYKHSAAQFLEIRGLIASGRTHPDSPSRPESDVPILRDIESMLKRYQDAE